MKDHPIAHWIARHWPDRRWVQKHLIGYALLMGLGSALALEIVLHLGSLAHAVGFMGTFGASCVLLFAVPDGALSQPRRIVLGYGVASVLGLLALALQPALWMLPVAVGLCISAMMVLDSVHPPAGSVPLVVYLTHPDPAQFLLWVGVGVVLLVMLSVGFHRVIDFYWQDRHQK